MKIKKALYIVLVLSTVVFLGLLFYYKKFYVNPPSKNIQGFFSLGRRYNIFVDKQNLRPENLDQLYKAIKTYSSSLSPRIVKWYKVNIVSKNPDSFILEHAMQIRERSKTAVAFYKDDIDYLAAKVRYFNFNGWMLNVSAPLGKKLDFVFSYLSYPSEIKLVSKGKLSCLAVDNSCVYITLNVPLGKLENDITNTGYLFLFDAFNLQFGGSYSSRDDLDVAYKEFINNGGVKYIRFTTVKKGSYVCTDEHSCDFGSQLDPEVILFKNLEVKDFELIYLLIPQHISPDSVEGYLVPFYEVYLEGTTTSNNDEYLIQMEVIIPTFKFD